MTSRESSELVSAQAEAARTLDRHISVTAGPGSGKTTVLVERYLHILQTPGVSIDQIVAITFTNRAASEMRERVRRKLDELIGKSDFQQAARWSQQKRWLDAAIITTIHGFCAGLLREFPLESGLDPEFALLDEHQTAMLEEAVAKNLVTELITSGDDIVSRLAAGIGRIKLTETLASIYRLMRSQGLNASEVVRQTIEGHSTRQDYDEAMIAVGDVMTNLIRTRGLTRVAEQKRKDIERQWPILKSKLDLGPAAYDIAQFCRDIEDLRKLRPSATGTLAPLVQQLDVLLWEREMGGLVPRIWLDFPARDCSGRLAEMAGDMERRLKAEKLDGCQLDFDDLQVGVLEMVDRHPEVLKKITARYRYFLVDEFQDTNSLQRDLMKRLALDQKSGVNVFIVGDPKQSIYGFRGADVQVFHEMARTLEGHGGALKPLRENFRSQDPLICCFNHIFQEVFAPPPELSDAERQELGYVTHEDSVETRGRLDDAPSVELLIDTGPDGQADFEESAARQRERDARQVAARCQSLVSGQVDEDGRPVRRFKYSDIAILFRAMTQASIYETVLRRSGVRYQTIQGRGFYDRQEITDLVQLLRFLDNRSDDLALAAILRSPLCGLSDDALLSIGAEELLKSVDAPTRRRRRRSLWSSLLRHSANDLIPDDERSTVAGVCVLLSELVEIRHRRQVSDVLRHAIDKTEYRTIVGASFEGAQRLANIEKLLALAERFEAAGPHNIRDFVRFVADFERSSGREGEGRIDESEDAVKLMTIHQAKGLQFPVVIIPELHRKPLDRTDWFILDRHRGLTAKVPDGRTALVAGATMEKLRQRAAWRERFESVRLLYVGATRAEDRLILTGVAPEPRKLAEEGETWLAWIWRALKPTEDSLATGSIDIANGVRVKLEMNLGDRQLDRPAEKTSYRLPGEIDLARTPAGLFPLLAKVDRTSSLGPSLSVTQLTNFTRCPRQYYLSRVVHAPERNELTAWDGAEQPEPPANLAASLKGAVVHMFCERYQEGMDPAACLSSSLDYILRVRMADRGEGVSKVNRGAAIDELRPLVQHYIGSKVRRRIDAARPRPGASELRITPHEASPDERDGAVFSEQSFTLRRGGLAVRGTIDKLLLTRDVHGDLNAEIIDFKTNKFRAAASPAASSEAIEAAASGVKMQMQIYALAVGELIPGVRSIQATLHFVDPDVEYGFSSALLEPSGCNEALNAAISGVEAASRSIEFPVRAGSHCRTCGFLTICQPGRVALRS